MAVRHVVSFKFNDDTTSADLDRISDAALAMSKEVEEVRGYSCGKDLGLKDDTYDLVAIADFDDADGYLRYSAHPAHRRFVEGEIKPILVHRSAVQYELP